MESTSDTSAQLNPNSRTPLPFPIRFIATGFFAGYSPIIPGTAGSLVGLALYLIPGMENSLILGIVSIVGFILGGIVSAKMEQHFGEDPQIVVIDEIIGIFISLLFLPKSIITILLAFILFRIYDTIKPQPARLFEHIQHGWGIMLDDVVAGIYTNITLWLLLMIFPGLF